MLYLFHSGGVVFVMFLIGISMVTGPGYYIFQIFDEYSVTIPLLVIALAQCIAVGWVHGSGKYVNQFFEGGVTFS